MLGWLLETAIGVAQTKRFVNKGFLEGPVCPVYGFGAVIILYIAEPLAAHPVQMFFAAMAIGFVLGVIASWFMRFMFKAEWSAPYKSKRGFVISAQIKNALVAGAFALAGTYFLHPLVEKLFGFISPSTQRVLASFILALYIIDLLYSFSIISSIGVHLQNVRAYVDTLRTYKPEEKWLDENNIPESLERLEAILAENATDENTVMAYHQLQTLLQKEEPGLRRLRDYPYIYPKGLHTTWETLLKQWEADRIEKKAKKKRKKEEAQKTYTVVPSEEAKKGDTFASGINFYKLAWVFLIACVLGFVIETIYCYLISGVIESRQGLVYGPLNQIYGMGAVIMVLLLRPIATKNVGVLFGAGAVIGGVFEYICSWVQELVFGTVSWNYEGQPLSFGGRTSIKYMFFWGVLAVVYIRYVYPILSKWVERIPKKHGYTLTWVMVVLLSVDIVISAAAVTRWSSRQQGAPATNVVEEFLDENYPNELLAEIYPSMQLAGGTDEEEPEQETATP